MVEAYLQLASSTKSRMTTNDAKSFCTERILPTADCFDRSMKDRSFTVYTSHSGEWAPGNECLSGTRDLDHRRRRPLGTKLDCEESSDETGTMDCGPGGLPDCRTGTISVRQQLLRRRKLLLLPYTRVFTQWRFLRGQIVLHHPIQNGAGRRLRQMHGHQIPHDL